MNLTKLLRVSLFAIPLVGSACADDITGQIPTADNGNDGTGTTSDRPTSTSNPTTAMTETDSVGTAGLTSGGLDTTAGPTTTLDGGTSTTTNTTASTSSTTTPTTRGSSSSGTGPDDGNCCVDHGSPGCDVAAVEICVCALDPFCCSTEWDQICVEQAIEDCMANCPGGATGSSSSGGTDSSGGNGSGGMGSTCCSAQMGPGCDDPGCETAVCAIDPFCCSAQWDGICAGMAAAECPVVCGGMGSSGGSGGTGGGGGDCCLANGSPGCDDAGCEMLICATDPFCCDMEWDMVCADQALVMCPVTCGGGSSGGMSSGSSSGSGGTGGSGGMGSGGSGGMGGSNCCVDNNGVPGCDDPVCEATVCGVDPFCCNTDWDGICADAALVLCPGVCPGGGGSGGTGGTSTGGTSTGGMSSSDSGGMGSAGMGTGDCCVDNGTPGCDDGPCEIAVCTVDPFCCSNTWDQICANQAGNLCPMLCPGGGTGGSGGSGSGSGTGGGGNSNCCIDHGGMGCDDALCEGIVCGIDPFCCNNTWDQICADHAFMSCGVLCGGPGGTGGPMGMGDCCAANGSPGCDDAGCEVAVCTIDPFCCDMEWDMICADQALITCPALCP